MDVDRESGPRWSSLRTLFIVAAKLLGVLQIYAVLSGLAQVVLAFSMLGRDASSFFAPALVAFISLIVSVVLSSLLLFGTGWLADRLGIPDDPVRFDLDRPSGLQLGIQLIGVYTTSWALPALIRSFAGRRPSVLEVSRPLDWRSWVPAALQLGIGLFLMLRSDVVTNWITRRREPVEDAETTGEAADTGDPGGPSIFE